MKHFIKIFMLIFVISSCQTDNKNSLDYCDQELNLIKGNSTMTVEYDFSLGKQEQFENFQSQIDINICNAVIPLNGKFCISTSDTIDVLIFSEKYCENDTRDNVETLCFLTRSLKINIDSTSQITIENEKVSEDSLTNLIAFRAEKFFIDNKFRYAIFDLEFDKNSPIDLKTHVFKKIIDGYLLAADKYSLKLYQKKLCELDSLEIQKIAKNFKLVIGVSDDLPTPPPPPTDLIDKLDRI